MRVILTLEILGTHARHLLQAVVMGPVRGTEHGIEVEHARKGSLDRQLVHALKPF